LIHEIKSNGVVVIHSFNIRTRIEEFPEGEFMPLQQLTHLSGRQASCRGQFFAFVEDGGKPLRHVNYSPQHAFYRGIELVGNYLPAFQSAH
jgi:hypothetical protein